MHADYFVGAQMDVYVHTCACKSVVGTVKAKRGPVLAG